MIYLNYKLDYSFPTLTLPTPPPSPHPHPAQTFPPSRSPSPLILHALVYSPCLFHLSAPPYYSSCPLLFPSPLPSRPPHSPPHSPSPLPFSTPHPHSPSPLLFLSPLPFSILPPFPIPTPLPVSPLLLNPHHTRFVLARSFRRSSC